MGEATIKVENVSKKYIIGQSKSTSLRDVLAHQFKKIFKGKKKSLEESFWALNDVSFEVRKGEVLGIIGKNGAGKSTLLKILSRITYPTSGRIEINGRVASLLEVGTGFHPDLSGRENIFMNGTLLGMSRKEVKAKLDEIIDFAGMGKFIDTPVKHYSSGMYVRLAFAVAAHLDPEILIIDEVLAVGDAEFKRKCLGKMSEVTSLGRTVIFVSHNMGAVKQLCQRCIFLEDGQIKKIGESSEVVDYYLKGELKSAEKAFYEAKKDSSRVFQVLNIKIADDHGELRQLFECSENIHIHIHCHATETIKGLFGYLKLIRKDGVVALMSESPDCLPNQMDGLTPGEHFFKITIPKRYLAPGAYLFHFTFGSHQYTNFNLDLIENELSIELSDNDTRRGNRREGFFSSLFKWEKLHA